LVLGLAWEPEPEPEPEPERVPEPERTPAGEPEAATDQCVATLSLPKGQITVQGLVDRTGPMPVTLAITAGTGAYRTAHGELQTSGPNEQGDELLSCSSFSDRRSSVSKVTPPAGRHPLQEGVSFPRKILVTHDLCCVNASIAIS
jgi:hypothetical protein